MFSISASTSITKPHLNYSLKSPTYSYEKEFDKIRETCNLRGQIKTVSNIACQYIITSNKEFFDKIGELYKIKKIVDIYITLYYNFL